MALLDINFTDLTLTAIGAVITILLTIIGYFLKIFGSSVTELKHAVDQLSIMVSVEKEKVKNIKESNEVEHALHDKDIESLYDRVDALEKEMIRIKILLENHG